MPGRALDTAVWAEILAYLGDSDRVAAGARRMAEDAEAQFEELAARRIAIESRLAALEAQAAYLLRMARETSLSAARLDAGLKEIDDEQAQLRLEHVRLDAEMALAREDVPKAAELAAVCAELRERMDDLATPAERRELLELLRVQVTMDGPDYHIRGVLPDLDIRGSLCAHSGRPLG